MLHNHIKRGEGAVKQSPNPKAMPGTANPLALVRHQLSGALWAIGGLWWGFLRKTHWRVGAFFFPLAAIGTVGAWPSYTPPWVYVFFPKPWMVAMSCLKGTPGTEKANIKKTVPPFHCPKAQGGQQRERERERALGPWEDIPMQKRGAPRSPFEVAVGQVQRPGGQLRGQGGRRCAVRRWTQAFWIFRFVVLTSFLWEGEFCI
jgi:hypothetical protein